MNNIILLGLVSFFTDISSDMIFPLIPVLFQMLGISPILLGTVEGVAISVSSLLKIYFGNISDKIKNRKFFATMGYFTSALGKLFLALSNTWPFFLLARSVDRLGKSIRTAPRDALISESISKDKQGTAFGLHRSMDTLGSVIGVFIAYIILYYSNNNIKTVFFWALIPALLGVLILAILVKEKSNKQLNNKKIPLIFSIKNFPKKLKLFFLISFIFALGNSSILFIILKAYKLGFTAKNIILLYGLFNLTHALFIYPASKLSDKIGRKYLLLGGYLIFGLIYLLIAQIKNPNMFWILLASLGLYMALTEGVEKAYVADLSSPDTKATALGAHATITGSMTLPASLLAGFLWEQIGSNIPFYFSSLTGFIATIMVSYFVVSKQEKVSQN